jgi:transcriptional regulator with XRE-family HTH domain
MPPTVTYIGLNLKFLRRIRGLSQTQLAKEVGLSRNNIASYETGMVEPNSKNFLKIAHFFEVNPQDMLEKILSDNPVEIVLVDDNPKDEIQNYLKDHLETFTIQTNSATKILEGYKEFYEMRKKEDAKEEDLEFYASMDNILDLMNRLVAANWELIQNIFPHQEHS